MKVVCFDLDDTLCKEIDYLKSAYQEIASYAAQQCTGTNVPVQVLGVKAYEAMLEAYQDGKNAFEALNAFLGLEVPVADMLQMYREHKPEIVLDEYSVETLNSLKTEGCVFGLITDGRSVQQRNKILALDLQRWFDLKDIVISEEFGSEKPCQDNYAYFMDRYPSASFTYVGDNPKKDFFGANALGWDTVCLLDDGRNIHKQEFEKYNEEYQPKYKISKISELLRIKEYGVGE